MWIKLEQPVGEISFNVEGLAEVRAGEKRICLIKKENSVHACAAVCPHAGADMQSGYIDSRGNIVCAKHGYRYSIKDGRCTEGYRLKIYNIAISDGCLWIEL